MTKLRNRSRGALFCVCLSFLGLLHCCSAQQPSGQILSNHTSLCMEIANNSVWENASAVQYTCHVGENQKFSFESVGATFYRIRAMHAGMCLTVQQASMAANANIIHTVCRDTDHQLWSIQNLSNSSSTTSIIKSKLSNMCIAVFNSSHNLSAPIVQETCDASKSAQRWFINTPLDATKVDLPGLWQGPYSLGIVPVGAANLPDGRILAWSSFSRMNYGRGGHLYTWTTIFNPVSAKSTPEMVVATNHDMFCPGTSLLPDGRVLISGGSNAEATTFYYPNNDTWVRGPNMTIPRGYQSQTVLPDGTVFTFGGSWSGELGGKFGEVYSDSPTPSWSVKTNLDCAGDLLTNDTRGVYRSDSHMWLFTAPNGKVFHAGPSMRTHWIDLSGNGTVTPSVFRCDFDAMNGIAVMYDTGKLFVAGGASNYDTGMATNRAFTINFNNEKNVVVTEVSPMHFNRTLVNAVVLPNGNVVVIGGQAGPRLFSDLLAVYSAEIWDPATGTFKLLPPMRVPRTYHSVAILLQDGRIFTGGGGLCGTECGTNHLDGEILTPPYLLHSNGTLRTDRPIITNISETRPTPGSSITVTMSVSDSYTCALVRQSAVTHSVNTDMRRIPLTVSASPSNQFTVTLPSNTAVALPGTYFLFVMNSAGVPSVARTISIPVSRFTKLIYRQNSLCAEVYNALMGSARIIQNNCTDVPYQSFRMEPVANQADTYVLIAKHSGKCMAISGGSTLRGGSVVHQECVPGATYQQFQLVGTGSERQIRPRHAPTMCVNSRQLSVQPGTPLVQLPCTNQTNDYWTVSAFS